MAKLHELLAVEADLDGKYKRIAEETSKTFKGRPAHFMGSIRTYHPFDDDDKVEYPEEYQALATTVEERLNYTAKAIEPYFDALLQKESTNQVAKADLVVDGEVIAKDLPATFLLGMESRLKFIRKVYEQIPTLPVSVDWEKDESWGKNVYRMTHPEEKLKTAKQFKSQVLYEATEHHPAQIEKWDENVAVGKFVKRIWSGAISSADKSRLLGRIDKLIIAVKKARQRANTTEVIKSKVGGKILDFIHRN
jgi:hypothetical protein